MSTASTRLNTDDIVLWFDDLGSGNEDFNFLSNFYEGEPIVLPGVFWQGTFRDSTSDVYADKHGVPLRKVTFKKFASAEEHTHHPVEFATGEHAFQAMKAKYIGGGTDFYRTATAVSPSESKALGRSLSLREDWEAVKYDLMAAIVRAKYAPGREEADRLLATGDKMLVEGTWWKDTVWGIDLTVEGLPGRNWLGTLLMARRAELRALETFSESALINWFVHRTAQHNAAYGL